MKFRFSFTYFLLAGLIFVIEILIATLLKNIYFIRAFIGDVLVVILLYFAILSIFKIKNRSILLLCIFIFSVIIEVAQYFKIAEVLGFPKGSIAHIVIGNYFSWGDIVCYAIGCILMYWIEKYKTKSI